MSTQPKAKRGPGKPWQKGQSGNPKGRKRSPVEDVIRRKASDAAERLAKLVDNADPNIALRASGLLLDRALGKPSQSIAIDAKVDAHVQQTPSVFHVGSWAVVFWSGDADGLPGLIPLVSDPDCTPRIGVARQELERLKAAIERSLGKTDKALRAALDIAKKTEADEDRD